MATLPAHTVLSNPQSFRCSLCRNIVIASGDTPETPICRTCLHDHAVWDALKLLADFKAMLAGRAPFDVLLPEERAEQIQQLLLCPLDSEVEKYIADPAFTEQVATAGTVRSNGGWVPTPEERKALEDRDEDEARAAIIDAEIAEQDPERWE